MRASDEGRGFFLHIFLARAHAVFFFFFSSSCQFTDENEDSGLLIILNLFYFSLMPISSHLGGGSHTFHLNYTVGH